MTRLPEFNKTKKESVSLVCCSYNRSAALRATFENKTSIRGVDQIVYVLDGSTDGSAEFLDAASKEDKRLSVYLIEHGGIQRARNYGIDQVETEWTLFIDDDDYAPEDFVECLLSTALKLNSDIAGAPWVNGSGIRDHATTWKSIEQSNTVLTFRSAPSEKNATEAMTPFLVSSFLGKTEAIRHVGFDPNFRGNSWREETDFFLRSLELGYKIARTSATYSWLERRYTGGHRRNKVAYEFWVLVNEIRFLRRHRLALRTLTPRWRGWLVEALDTSLSRIFSLALSGLNKFTSKVEV